MPFFRACLVGLPLLLVVTPTPARAATCDKGCEEVTWYWHAQQTRARQFYAAVIAATPQAECVAGHESATAGLYLAQNRSGASGKYQFMPGTGDTVNRALGRDDLVGLPARDWAPWDQDLAFGWAWAHWGGSPWSGECGNAPLN